MAGTEIHKGMTEAEIERSCVPFVRRLGGELYKWVCPGQSNVPDRILDVPGTPIVFVEFKRPGKKLRAGQANFAAELRQRGREVWGPITSYEDFAVRVREWVVKHAFLH